MATDVCRVRLEASPIAESAGVGLLATSAVRTGELIFSISKPLVTVPDMAHLAEVCSNCLRWVHGAEPGAEEGQIQHKPFELKSCAGCGIVKYCDKVSDAYAARGVSHCQLSIVAC